MKHVSNALNVVKVSIVLSAMVLTLALAGIVVPSSAVAKESDAQKVATLDKSKMDDKSKHSNKKATTKKDDEELGSYTLEDGSRLGAYGDGVYGN